MDTLSIPGMGRRKSWIIPIQMVSSALLIMLGGVVDNLGECPPRPPVHHLHGALAQPEHPPSTARRAVSSATWDHEVSTISSSTVSITALFTALIFLAATQDIAVDGWALELLSGPAAGFASSCQTLGMSIGWFLSYTTFLALNGADFCPRFLSWALECPEGSLVSLKTFMRASGVFLAFVTLVVVLWPEAPRESTDTPRPVPPSASWVPDSAVPMSPAVGSRSRVADDRQDQGTPVRGWKRLVAGCVPGGVEGKSAGPAGAEGRAPELAGGESDEGQAGGMAAGGIAGAYRDLWGVLRLPALRNLALLLLVYRLPFLPVEMALNLELIERGFARESVAFLSVAMLPIEILAAVVAGAMATAKGPQYPFSVGMWLRFVTAAANMGVVTVAAHVCKGTWLLVGLVMAGTGLQSVSGTLMFTAQGALFGRISDPDMGGAYLTLLNTIANLGFTLPKLLIFWAMDALTIKQCSLDGAPGVEAAALRAIYGLLSAVGMGWWIEGHMRDCEADGQLVDGFYVVAGLSLVGGLAFRSWANSRFEKMAQCPVSAWRASKVEGPSRAASRTELQGANGNGGGKDAAR